MPGRRRSGPDDDAEVALFGPRLEFHLERAQPADRLTALVEDRVEFSFDVVFAGQPTALLQFGVG